MEHPQSKPAIWLLAIRPKTLGAAIAPVLMGSAIAYADGKMHLITMLVTMFCTLLIQIGTNFANDYYDFVKGSDTADRLGPTRATQAGLVTPRQMKTAFIIVFALAFLCGQYLIWRGGWPILLVGILSILFGILYTGGPYPLGYNGLGDIFVLIFFGPVAVGGSHYVQAQELSWIAVLAGLGPGLISTALLTVNNLRDIHTDRASGKRTMAVRFGIPFTRYEYLFSILIACFLPVLLISLTGGHLYALATIALIAVALPSIRVVFRESGSPLLNNILAKTGQFLLLYSVVFSIGWVI